MSVGRSSRQERWRCDEGLAVVGQTRTYITDCDEGLARRWGVLLGANKDDTQQRLVKNDNHTSNFRTTVHSEALAAKVLAKVVIANSTLHTHFSQ